MSRKYNTGKGGKKAKGYGGSGMKKHGTSGIPHNHAISIARTREYNREQERLAEIKKKQKSKPEPLDRPFKGYNKPK